MILNDFIKLQIVLNLNENPAEVFTPPAYNTTMTNYFSPVLSPSGYPQTNYPTQPGPSPYPGQSGMNAYPTHIDSTPYSTQPGGSSTQSEVTPYPTQPGGFSQPPPYPSQPAVAQYPPTQQVRAEWIYFNTLKDIE